MNPALVIHSTPSSGNGVYAKTSITADTLLLATTSPAFFVLYAKYRKEVCAFCWTYCQGRTLKVKDEATGSYFCQMECAEAWNMREGIIGREVSILVWSVIKCRKNATKLCGEEDDETGLDKDAVDKAWAEAEAEGESIRKLRMKSCISLTKREKNHMNHILSAPVNVDVLSFLVAGILYLYRRSPDQNTSGSLDELCQEDVPYIDSTDLAHHITAFLHLLIVFPIKILPLLTVDNIRLISSAAYHNVFGIRSIDHATVPLQSSSAEEPGSEVLGKALIPKASFFNHSCLPNVKKFRVGRVWNFFASRDIETGEEVCITYLGGDERSIPLADRRELLSLGWDFGCRCSRCLIESTADDKQGILVP